jgi:hypothetical protein
MGNMRDSIGHLTLLDLSLPGTHDTLTYDLSLRVSDGGIDGSDVLAELLHNYTAIIPNGIEDYIRQQAQTHDLDIVSQLNNGMRFIDFRQMFEYSDGADADWYSLHMIQSVQTCMVYLTQIRQWMDIHDQEIVVLWLSKHGDTSAEGGNQYPNTPIEAKQKYWQQIEGLFQGLLVDFSVTKINETTVASMISSNQRLVIYASDYVEFTGSSKYALDAKLIDNRLGPSCTDEVNALAYERSLFAEANSIKAADRANQVSATQNSLYCLPGMSICSRIQK